MAVSERQRHGLYEKPRQAFGDEEAGTLMEMLASGADIAAKVDVLVDEVRVLKDDVRLLKHDVLGVNHGVLAFDAKLHREINRLIFWLVPVLLAYGAALVRLG